MLHLQDHIKKKQFYDLTTEIAGTGPNADSECGSESGEEQEVTMPTLESLEPQRNSVSPPSSSKLAGGSNPMDLLKNPFLMPASLLALNPQLYAAQLAQLQAAQMMLAKQQAEGSGWEKNGSGLPAFLADRKRSIEEDSPLDLGSKAKYPRSSSPIDGRTEPTSESPLDLSGNKSPEVKRELGSFNPHLLPPNILSFFSQLKPPSSGEPFPGSSPSSPPRPLPWQTQWPGKGSEGTGGMEDVFKCVWCKESYQTLEGLTTHMKEAKHHSLPYPLPNSQSLPGRVPPVTSPLRTSVASMSMASPASSTQSTSPKPAPARDVLKEQLPLPRKLVRGQDVWIGRAEQQTRDILKCMGCGASFRSLDLLTKHMQETQHYKKVISHDQISSWKYPEAAPSPKNHVNSVLTCKVCDKGFSSLKDLSDHMVKANHYSAGEAKPPLRSLPATPSVSAQAQAAKDRKKALPVKKLLELERARHEVLGGASGAKAAANSARDIMESGKLFCERCEDRIPLDLFIGHIQTCVGKPRFMSPPPVKQEAAESRRETSDKAETDKKTEGGNSSILGSLEQLVKGNFQNSRQQQQRQQGGPSPPAAAASSILNPAMAKFSIQSMFPKQEGLSVPPTSPGNSSGSSKPTSPSSSRPSSAGQASLERRGELSCAGEGETNGKAKPETDYSGSARGTPSPGTPAFSARASPKSERSEGEATSNKTSSEKSENPLAALQMLCDTQKKSPKLGGNRPPAPETSQMSDPGAMLAFSWACNQAQVSNDSVIKCPFCDTPFISKGAYRHHLSKMHFTKEGGGVGGAAALPAGAPLPPASGTGATPGSTVGGLQQVSQSPSPPPTDAKEDETLQSKYHKYAQLAKQLSCNQK